MRLHHIGKVVKDLQEAVDYYRDTFGLKAVTSPIIDPIQKVEVVFVQTGPNEDITIELVRPISQDSPVAKFLEKGGGLHHLCFEVENIEESIKNFRDRGALLLGNPVPGKGHNDRMTAWIYTTQKELIELVEKAKR